MLTVEPRRRTQRLLDAALDMYQAGELVGARALLRQARADVTDRRRAAAIALAEGRLGPLAGPDLDRVRHVRKRGRARAG